MVQFKLDVCFERNRFGGNRSVQKICTLSPDREIDDAYFVSLGLCVQFVFSLELVELALA